MTTSPRTLSEAVDVDAAPDDVFAVYADVEGWPGWTASMTEVRRLDAGPLRVGSRARVRQPGLPVTIWTVTDLTPGRSFTWERRTAGLRTVGRHLVDTRAGGSRVRAELQLTGLLAPMTAALTGRLLRRYLRLETEGLKRRCEPPVRSEGRA